VRPFSPRSSSLSGSPTVEEAGLSGPAGFRGSHSRHGSRALCACPDPDFGVSNARVGAYELDVVSRTDLISVRVSTMPASSVKDVVVVAPPPFWANRRFAHRLGGRKTALAACAGRGAGFSQCTAGLLPAQDVDGLEHLDVAAAHIVGGRSSGVPHPASRRRPRSGTFGREPAPHRDINGSASPWDRRSS